MIKNNNKLGKILTFLESQPILAGFVSALLRQFAWFLLLTSLYSPTSLTVCLTSALLEANEGCGELPVMIVL